MSHRTRPYISVSGVTTCMAEKSTKLHQPFFVWVYRTSTKSVSNMSAEKPRLVNDPHVCPTIFSRGLEALASSDGQSIQLAYISPAAFCGVGRLSPPLRRENMIPPRSGIVSFFVIICLSPEMIGSVLFFFCGKLRWTICRAWRVATNFEKSVFAVVVVGPCAWRKF